MIIKLVDDFTPDPSPPRDAAWADSLRRSAEVVGRPREAGSVLVRNRPGVGIIISRIGI
jgi:hypothetical protein